MPLDPARRRRVYIDWARGLAVLLMIEAHTFDAWTRPLSRSGWFYTDAIIVGGFAAPLFLWLAGVGVALSATSLSGRSGSRAAVDRICRRGLEIFILAFAFRLQSFIVTPGSYPVTLFRVDILNVMGPAIVLAGLVWAVSARPAIQVAVYAGLACAFAMLTPVVRASAIVDALPTWLQWYVRPSGDYTTFTLFPWAGFVLGGAACGVLIARARAAATERWVHVALAAVGAAVVTVGVVTAARPSIYAQSSFWTSSPTYFAIRLGILMVGFTATYAAASIFEALGIRIALLERFGQNSLFVYWIHVELVYGYATWPLRRHLPLWGTCLAFAAFCALMYAAVGWRDRVMEAWRERKVYGRSLVPR